MRSIRLTSATLLLALWSVPAFATDPSVRSAINKDGSGPAGAGVAFSAFGTDPVSGDAIVVMVTRAGGSATGSAAPTDSRSNTYTAIGTEQCGTWNASICISMWRAFNITGGSSFVITLHWASATPPTWFGAVAYDVRDVKVTDPYNGDFAKAAAAAATTASVSTAVTPAANSLALAGVSTNCANNSITNGSGWVTPTGGSMTSNNNQDLYGETKTVSAAYTADWSSPSCAHTMLTASFAGVAVATLPALTLAP